ncbi:hypothetical protein Drorol1_Dr00002598 [Drosera rotundifolia]
MPWTIPCCCHAICVEGCLAVAAATAFMNGADPNMPYQVLQCLLIAWACCANCGDISRQSLQEKYHLENTPCHPCLVHSCFCLHWCALCQEHRELSLHRPDYAISPMTPPPVQQMCASGDPATSSANRGRAAGA